MRIALIAVGLVVFTTGCGALNTRKLNIVPTTSVFDQLAAGAQKLQWKVVRPGGTGVDMAVHPDAKERIELWTVADQCAPLGGMSVSPKYHCDGVGYRCSESSGDDCQAKVFALAEKAGYDKSKLGVSKVGWPRNPDD